MANTFLIKHGSSAPTSSNLQSYELGFSTSTNSLYLNNGSAILRFQNSDQTENKFLQLSGGTLTGTLNGTSIVCTGDITAPNFIGIASSANATNANSNVCDIARGYNYDSGELHINYQCATTGKPILKYFFRDGNKGYSSIYCKNLETSGTITSTGNITATSITSTVSTCARYVSDARDGGYLIWSNGTGTYPAWRFHAGGDNSWIHYFKPDGNPQLAVQWDADGTTHMNALACSALYAPIYYCNNVKGYIVTFGDVDYGIKTLYAYDGNGANIYSTNTCLLPSYISNNILCGVFVKYAWPQNTWNKDNGGALVSIGEVNQRGVNNVTLTTTYTQQYHIVLRFCYILV